ncbi:UNVERIFIED_CONTAM: hypothetical protein HDU68_006079, partial [Siphonaria sp. JEL0065]
VDLTPDLTKVPVIKFEPSLPTKSAYYYVDNHGVMNIVSAPFSSFKRLKESKQQQIKDGEACYLSRCRRQFVAEAFEVAGHLFCNESCATEHKRAQDEANAKLKRTNEWVFLKSAADNWRNNKCHKFSVGEWNEKSQKLVPNSRIAQHFFLRLIRSRSEGCRFVVRSLNDVHQVPTDEDFETLKDWFIQHADLIDGAETLRRLVFLADSGLDQASMDRRFSNLGADEIGQEWVLDGEGWNRFKNDKSPHQLAEAIIDLRHSRFEEGTRIWSLYMSNIFPQSQLTQDEREQLRVAIVKKWESQEVNARNSYIRVKNPNAAWRNDIRDWDADDMVKYFLVKLGGVVPSTGLKMTPESVACDR